MMRLVTLLLAFFAAEVFALDPIWNMHYTLGPDSRRAPKFALGAGVSSDFGSNLGFPVNVLGAISNEFEIGAKMDVRGYESMDHVQLSIDVGGKYHLSPGNFIEVDGYFGLNRNNKSAIVLSYGLEQFIAKNFSNFYEVRAGFLDGVTGADGYMKLVTAMTPTLNFGSMFRWLLEINMSESIGHIQDDFMIDIIPKIELSLNTIRIRLDFDIGVMQESNNDQKSISLYAMKSL